MTPLYIFDLVGTFAFATSGALLGINKRMDLYGQFILALVTAVGGGTLRDVLFGRIPPFIFNDINYLIAVILATLLVFFFHIKVNKSYKLLTIFDAVGLGVIYMYRRNNSNRFKYCLVWCYSIQYNNRYRWWND